MRTLTNLTTRKFSAVMLAGLLSSLALLVACANEPIVRPMDDNPPTGKLAGSYIDIYQDRDFKGSYFRVWGPATYQSMAFNGRTFNDISSVIAGPNAYVRLGDGDERENHSFWVMPGQRYSDLSKLNFEDKIRLIEVRDRAPEQMPVVR